MKCCICGKEISGYGNNPDPIMNVNGELFDISERCCDECNDTYVIPMRLAKLTHNDVDANIIQQQVNFLKSQKLRRRLFVLIERLDGSTYEQEIELIDDDIKKSIREAQAMLGEGYLICSHYIRQVEAD